MQCSCSKETITSLSRNRELTVWTQDSSHSRAVWMMTTLREAVGRAASSPVPPRLLLLVASRWKTIPSTMTLYHQLHLPRYILIKFALHTRENIHHRDWLRGCITHCCKLVYTLKQCVIHIIFLSFMKVSCM